MIYFFQYFSGEIKIGTSTDVGRRTMQLNGMEEGILIKSIEGGRSRERAIHQRFAHLRIGRTEKFRPGEDLMAFIESPTSLVDNGPARGVVFNLYMHHSDLSRLDDLAKKLGGSRSSAIRHLLDLYDKQSGDVARKQHENRESKENCQARDF